MRYITILGKGLLLLVVGLVLAIYPVFLILFTDKHSQSDYVTGLIFVGSVFLIATGITAMLLRSRRTALWIALPSIVVLVMYSLRETQQIRYHLAVLVVLLLGTVVGGVFGSRFRGRKGPGTSRTSS